MSIKKFLLLIISLVLFGLALACLVVAIIIQALNDEKTIAPVLFGILSFVSAFIAVITTCFYGKGEKK